MPPRFPDDEPPYNPPRRPHREEDEDGGSFKPLVYLLLLAFGVALGLGAFYVVSRGVGGRGAPNEAPAAGPATNPDAEQREATANGPLGGDESEANRVFEAAKGSVVNVDTVLQKRDRLSDRLQEQQTGTGSGFVWDAEGRIVTNFHVVQDVLRRPGMAIRVVLADRSAHEARLVGTAPDVDLAVVKIDPGEVKGKLVPLGLATSGDLKVGQRVYAIGNPFGLSLTLTDGIVSALDRTIEAPTTAPINGAVQHTAPINPGNSGGPLLNRAGKLVGVNTSIATPTGGNVGIGLAIPADGVNQVVTDIIRTGRSQAPDLGVRLYEEKKLRRAGYDTGVMVAEVVPNGPAARAGIRGIGRTGTGRVIPGDIIVGINDERIDGTTDFQRVVGRLRPGDRVRVRFLRDDAEQEVTLVLQGV
ncbi:MAG TPA: trypsin-like peptidase domain-containing protein [Urbifossiella sp.]|nr:trypsin-like peptidase domain-containing protein [Urbifossiella sp.]